MRWVAGSSAPGSSVPGSSAPGLAAACAAALITATLSGCSPLGAPPPPPSGGRTSTTSGARSAASARPASPSPLAQAQASHEYPSPPPPAQTVPGAARTPADAIHAFAEEYINWTAATVAAQMQALARQSIGQARSAMELAGAQTAQDYELQRGGIANSGMVEAISPLLGHRDQFVVVTRELTSATVSTAYQGLHPAWHLALATVVALGPGQWVLSGWQPEN